MAENLQTAQVISKIFGVTTRRVEQLKAEGIITGQGRPTKYDLLPTIQAYIKYLSDKAYGREKKESVADLEKNKLQADVEIKQSKAKIAEMQLKELEGKMHRSEDVEAMTNNLVYTVRSMVSAIPGRSAMDAYNAGSAAEVSAIIRAECNKVLEELSNYTYDPEAYQKRVREREGWGDTLAEEETDE